MVDLNTNIVRFNLPGTRESKIEVTLFEDSQSIILEIERLSVGGRLDLFLVTEEYIIFHQNQEIYISSDEIVGIPKQEDAYFWGETLSVFFVAVFSALIFSAARVIIENLPKKNKN